ncbi:MAG: helicase-associated domain-containing protein [Micrococcus sp.]|nr:helicase-associated domain-containing protein [Micrococcus sp.]
MPDFAALAARASTQMSVLRALDGLDRAHLDVLEALAAMARIRGAGLIVHAGQVSGASQVPDAGQVTSRARLADFLGAAGPDDCGADPVDAVLTDLAESALVLPVDDGWQLPLAVATALGPHPLGLGRSRAVLVPDDGSASSGEQPRVRAGLPATEHLTDRPEVPATEHLTDRPEVPAAEHPADRAGILADLANRTDDPELLARATAALDALQSAPVARLPVPPGPVHDLLLRAGLLIRTGHLPDGTTLAEHPLEAGLAWRDGTVGRCVDTVPPAPTDGSVPAALSSNAALAAITDLLRGCADLLTALAEGLPTLRSGGVGVRELKRLADSTGSTPEDTSWLLELLAAAGLIVLDPDTSRWVVAAESADWWRSGRHLQWEALVLGWLGSGRAPMLGPAPTTGSSPSVSGAPAAARATPSPAGGGRALAADRNRPDAPRLRASVLETALELEEERPGVRLDEAVARRLHWRSPRQSARTAVFTAPLLAEAARLGLTGAGALTTAGALVAEGCLDEAADAVGTALPAPLTRVRLQGDLTAVAPGYLDPGVAAKLASMADAEGDGAARVYRFSDDSLHRALDSGLDAAAIEEFLDTHSEDELPQSLRYLVRDVARRHGALTVGTAGSWLRVEDEALLEAIVADPALAGAGLERVAPTVVVAAVGERDLHRMLTAAGHRAARRLSAQGGSGTAADPGTGTAGLEASGPRPSSLVAGAVDSVFPAPVRAVRWAPSEEELAAQVARLRAAPRPAPTGPGTEEAVVLLRHAARQRTEVDLVTVDQRGHRQSLRVVPLAVAGGRVRCLVPAREAETVVPLHRVVSAEPAAPTNG